MWRRPVRVVVHPTPDDPEQQHADTLLTETREELAHADSKASILLGAATVALGVLAAPIAGNNGWKPNELTVGYETVFWIGVALIAFSLVLLGLAVYPRTKTSRFFYWVRRSTRPPATGRADYFGDLARARNLDDARNKTKAAAHGRFDRTVQQAWVQSKLVTTKYAYTRWAFRTQVLGAALVLAALIDGQ